MWSPPQNYEGGSGNSCAPCEPPTGELLPQNLFQTSPCGTQQSNTDESSSMLVPYASRSNVAHANTHSGLKRPSSPAPPLHDERTPVSISCGSRGKRRKTTSARQDLCCFCSVSATCHKSHCPCAKAGRPCLNCDPIDTQCTNSVDAINERIEAQNQRNQRGSTSRRFRTALGIRPTPPCLPLIRHPDRQVGDGNDNETVDVPISQLSQADTAADDSNASVQADDTDATLTQDSIVAALEDHWGNPNHHLADDIGYGNTANDVDAAEAGIAEAVEPITTNTADGAAVVVAVGVQEVVRNEDDADAEAADAEADAIPTGDVNQTVRNNANANVINEAAAIGEPIGDHTGIAGAGVADVETPPAAAANEDAAHRVNVEYSTPQRWTSDELRRDDPFMQDTMPADQRLISIYGDTIHQNDGRHLDGGIGVAEDRKWQRLYMRVAACKSPLYDLPNGCWAVRFLQIQTQLLRDARTRKCNSEKPLIFAPCILRKVKDVKVASDIKKLILCRLDMWDAGKYCALVKGVEEEAQVSGFGATHTHEFEVESAGWRYESMVLSGKIRAAVRMVTDRDPGGPFKPDDKCTKSGRPVIDVLREKHPKAVIPSDEEFDTHPDGPEAMESPSITCYEENVAKAASKLSGGAGPCGVEGIMLRNWLLWHGNNSELLREELGQWVYWLSNGSPPYAAYRALNAVRVLAADKRPGVRPLGCGETWMRLIANCNHLQTRNGATAACGNVHLCTGLRSGIEANLHAVRAIWPQSMGWTQDAGGDEVDDEAATVDSIAATMQALETNDGRRATRDPGAAEDDRYSRYTPETGFGSALFDARNAFNELNRYLMLWNVAHLWNRGSRFAFNRYRHWGLCLVRDRPGKPAIVIHSKEGVTQGDCFAMSLYGTALLPLARKMRDAVPTALQPWFADDSGSAGEARTYAACLDFLVKVGPKYGYFADPSKSYYICKGEDEAVARSEFEKLGLDINFSRGQRYLGGFIGSGATKEKWLGEMVAKWAAAVETLAKVASKYPQTAYTGFTFCLQNEWQYLQRVVADTGPFFEPLEKAIRTQFIPALMGLPAGDIDGKYRELLTHSVTKGGLALRNPMDTAASVHAASLGATLHLTRSLVDGDVMFDLGTHLAVARDAGQAARSGRLEREQRFLNAWASDLPADKRRDKRNCASGVWLTVVPSRLNGTSISADEWRDNVRLRYNHLPLNMPQHCDGCNERMTVEHALSCKKGGLVHIRHDDVADEWRHLCGTALSFGRVEREPRIYSSVGRRAREVGDTAVDTPATGERDGMQTTEERGDAGIHGFWQWQRTAIFDVRITDTDARSARGRDYTKVLAAHEKEKKTKYLESCL